MGPAVTVRRRWARKGCRKTLFVAAVLALMCHISPSTACWLGSLRRWISGASTNRGSSPTVETGSPPSPIADSEVDIDLEVDPQAGDTPNSEETKTAHSDSKRHRLQRWYRRWSRRIREPTTESEWSDVDSRGVSFGGEKPVRVHLKGASLEEAEAWLFGANESDDSADRIIQHVKPAGGEVRKLLPGEGPPNATHELSIPRISLPGAGALHVSMYVRGEVCCRVQATDDIPEEGECVLEIGTVGIREAALVRSGGAGNTTLDFTIDLRGELAAVPVSDVKSEVRGWIAIDVNVEASSVKLPRWLVRLGAREVCRWTIMLASSRLSRDMAKDFAAWREQGGLSR
mmetsp:Transcript_3572/g.7838  ORF Transcript_3572/g.7838 Transcript_3572/m.7838 type:complete len:344 (+) Transcript_3572:65-1096(+)